MNDVILPSGVQLSGLNNINESLSVHYTIYKIVNNINQKYYYGQHKTENIYDKYMGSSEILHKAIKKYGLSNFTKIILFDYDNFSDMNNKEAELIPLSNCYPYNKLSYNLKEGGINGQLSQQSKKYISEAWQFRLSSMTDDDKRKMTQGTRDWFNNLTNDELQQWKNKISISCKKHFEDPENRKKISESLSAIWQDQKLRQNLSKKLSGENNPMYGEHLSNHMDLEKYKKFIEKSCATLQKIHQDPQYSQKISERTKGKNNPMYGKSSWTKQSDEQIKIRKEKFTRSISGRIHIINRKLNRRTYIKKEELNKYLLQGYEVYSPAKNKTNMYKPGDLHGIRVDKSKVNEYLNLGYVLGKPANLIGKHMKIPGSICRSKLVYEKDFQKYLDLGYKFIDENFKYIKK